MHNNSDTLEVSDISKQSSGPIRFALENGERLPTVLVVDDDIDSLTLMCYILEKFSCIALCETNGRAAFDTIWKYQPDLIILDNKLPQMSGLDIIRALKRDEATRTTPIIMVTALVSHHHRLEVLCMGGVHYVAKPYLLEELEVIIHCYLPSIPNPIAKSIV